MTAGYLVRRTLIAAALSAAVVHAADIPVAGTRITLHGSLDPSRRAMRALIRDESIALPAADFRTNSGTIVVSGGAADGQCFASLDLHPDQWRLVSAGNGMNAYQFLARYPDGGFLRIRLTRGFLSIRARGVAWPCALSASSQRLPLTLELRLGDDRYCAAFGGHVSANRIADFRARDAAAPATCPKSDLTVADLNILHGVTGIACLQSDGCRRPGRIDLLFQWIAATGCPDVVTLQEVSDPAVPLLMARLTTVCPFPYNAVHERRTAIDDQMILSRYPVATQDLRTLYGGFRTALFARIDHPIGPLDVFTTHLASSSDGAQTACGLDCPTECTAAGAATVRECQGVQLASFVAARHDVRSPAMVSGDFNETPAEFVYDHLVGRGWIDTYSAAGNPECDPVSGIGCTSGREDQELTDLESPEQNEIERIDYIFLVPSLASSCSASIDPAGDADGDGVATRLFTDEPNPFAAACGPAPLPVCWPSDHEGVQADINCS